MAIRDILFDEAPELLTADEDALARIDRFIANAALEVNRSAWGDRADLATALLAAHRLTLRGRGGENRGGLTAEKVGDIEERYAAAPAVAGATELSTTTYGAEYQRMRRGIYRGGFATS